MGHTASAVLFYGYAWEAESNPLEELRDRYDPTDEYDICDYAYFLLRKQQKPAGFDACRALEKTLGIEMGIHGHYDYPGLYLALEDTILSVTMGEYRDVGKVLADIPKGGQTQLKKVLKDLGVDAPQLEPGWRLVARYW
jgi:hypothetical protein